MTGRSTLAKISFIFLSLPKNLREILPDQCSLGLWCSLVECQRFPQVLIPQKELIWSLRWSSGLEFHSLSKATFWPARLRNYELIWIALRLKAWSGILIDEFFQLCREVLPWTGHRPLPVADWRGWWWRTRRLAQASRKGGRSIWNTWSIPRIEIEELVTIGASNNLLFTHITWFFLA